MKLIPYKQFEILNESNSNKTINESANIVMSGTLKNGKGWALTTEDTEGMAGESIRMVFFYVNGRQARLTRYRRKMDPDTYSKILDFIEKIHSENYQASLSSLK